MNHSTYYTKKCLAIETYVTVAYACYDKSQTLSLYYYNYGNSTLTNYTLALVPKTGSIYINDFIIENYNVHISFNY